jgi:hypothetical protein
MRRVNCLHHEKRRYLPVADTAFEMRRVSISAAALALLISTATASARAEFHATIQFESVHVKIDFDGLSTLKKLIVNDILVTVHLKCLVRIVGLIQSHGQAWPPSAALV